MKKSRKTDARCLPTQPAQQIVDLSIVELLDGPRIFATMILDDKSTEITVNRLVEEWLKTEPTWAALENLRAQLQASFLLVEAELRQLQELPR